MHSKGLSRPIAKHNNIILHMQVGYNRKPYFAEEGFLGVDVYKWFSPILIASEARMNKYGNKGSSYLRPLLAEKISLAWPFMRTEY